ncbi:MAG: protein O-mannosyl-transferase, partial [Verrucomicrobiota bacterium]
TTSRSIARYLQKHWLRALLLALIGFAVHAPALQGQLIWDDQYLARDNPFIKSPVLAIEAFRHYLFLDSFSAHYRPVQNLSLMFDYFFWNTNTFGFHLSNVLLHLAAGVLLYFLLRRIFDSLGQLSRKIDNSILALAVAAVWMVHPVHSAAVDYISGRADSLAFAFAAAAWLLFFKARDRASRISRAIFYFFAASSALAALCSRESALIWVALFLLYLFAFGKSSRRSKSLTLAACVLIVASYAALRQLPQQRPGSAPSMGWSAPVRAILVLRALGDYSRLIVFPSNLHMERTIFDGPAFQSETARDSAIALEYLSILGGIVLASLGAASFWRGTAQRARIFGAAWFVIGFLPISNIVDLNATVAEHWLYLPSVGALIFIAACAVELRIRKWHAAAALTLIVAALAARSSFRSSDWVDPQTFYTRTAEAGGTSGRVSVNLGQIYINNGDYAKAERLFRNVLKFQPDYTIARNNLANALSQLGRDDEAKQVLAEATAGAHESRRDYPRTWIAAVNYARMLDSQNDSAGAIEVLRKAHADYPETWELVSYESELHRRANDLCEAIELVRPFAEKTWWHYAAWMALGRLYAENEDVDLAHRALLHASWLDLRASDPLNLIALMQMRQNHLDDAFRSQRRAVARQPEQPHQYVLLSNILDKMGRTEESRAALAQVSRLRALAATSPPHPL